MRRNRKARILVWPTLAATAIIAVLLSSNSLQRRCAEWTGHALRPFAGNRPPTGRSGASTRPLYWPQPLAASGFGSRTSGNESWRGESSPSDHRILVPVEAAAAAGSVRTEAWLVRPGMSATARLHAPVRDEREELAGFDGLDTSPETSFESSGFDSAFRVAASSERATTSLPRYIQAATPLAADAPTSRVVLDETLLRGSGSLFDGTAVPQAIGAPRREEQPSVAPLPRLRGAAIAAATARRDRNDVPQAGAAWPATPALDELLIDIARRADAAGWASRIRRKLAVLQGIPSLTDPRSGPLLAELKSLAEVGLAVGEQQVHDRDYQDRLLRTAHALQRRAVVWEAVWRVGARSEEQENVEVASVGASAGASGGETDVRMVSTRGLRSEPLDGLLADVRRHATTTGDAEGWQQYLLLDQIGRLAETADAEQRRIVAQRFLSRLQWDALEAPQVEWLSDASVRRLATRVRPWADSPIDYADLLVQLERQESDAIDLGGIEVATAVQTLRFAGRERAVDVAEAINTYYRNANVRIAVSAEFLQRLLPEVPTRTTAIAQTIQGAPVRGAGQIESQLQIELLPDPQAWNLRLGTDGTIRSRTATQRGPVQVNNRTRAAFVASTPIRIDRHGFRVGDTDVAVESQTRLGGMQTDFDGFPLVESLVRSIAMYQYDQAVGPARQESESLMRAEIDRTLSAEVEQQIGESSERLSARLLGPLARLQLAPLVVDLETSETRLSARYRVAGDWQLAGFTPRPRAMSDSLLSLQIHQSALNNTFERLAPSEAPQPIRELTANLLEMFGAPDASVPEEMPRDVYIQFAATRPITVEIEDDRLWMTLRIVRLTREGGIDLSHFIVRAAYRAEKNGMQARLVRDGGLQISGPRMGMRERLPVRAIFNTVLSEDRPLPLVNAELAAHPAAKGLEVRTLELTDGWLGLAIGPEGVLSTEY